MSEYNFPGQQNILIFPTSCCFYYIFQYNTPVWSVTFVGFEVGINADVMDGHLATELDVDHVRLRTIRLPVRLKRFISQLLNTETCDKKNQIICGVLV